MSVQRFKVSLNAARFPLISTKGSRAVFVPGLDSAPRVPRQFVGAEPNIDYNTAQVLYMENVMPMAEGLRSVGYEQKIPDTVNSDFDSLVALRDSDENVVLYSPSKGKNYIYDHGVSQWKTESIASIFGYPVSSGSLKQPETANVSYAYVDGRTFVCYQQLRSADNKDMSIMHWNAGSIELEPAGDLIKNLPFPPGTIDGVSSSSGFLIVWSGLQVAWAPFDGTSFDFLPYKNGDFSGAGSQIPEDVQGPILAIAGVSGGFMCFTSKNCVAANYHAQNIVAPWLFREVPGSGGAGTYEVITVEGTLGAIYAYTTSGLQRITLNSAEPIHPQIADFITGRQIERYDEYLNQLVQSGSGQDLAIKLTNIGNRYIAISYGLVSGHYEYVLIWDMMLERFGKLKFDHVDCFSYGYTPTVQTLTYAMAENITYADMDNITYGSGQQDPTHLLNPAQHALGLLTSSGAIFVADWTDQTRVPKDAGVIVLGRIQLTRSGRTQLNRIAVEGMRDGEVGILPSNNGRDSLPFRELVLIESSPGFAAYGDMIDCLNFDIVLKGAFNPSTIIVEAVRTGQM